ncbi:DUF1145 family protein [Tatumella sp. TA1]|uniref:DUF1145 family protein n=1 Tax=Rosenbergiella collisarenosi TaxID=1544695 RepID=UPI0008F8901A|nr:DUF1145 family protein [Rosenbergiella collisarenosi]MBT0722220.1 DUF1145 family protein [Rosenbergiella collisarenosi]QGX90173.1 DUF1145 family protein [Tatumella sp. TA1]
MLINAGRAVMLFIWAVLLLNLIHPATKPLKYFIDVALIFMVVMHGLQLVLLKSTQMGSAPKLSRKDQIRIFIFGVFELLSWQKKNFPKQ